MDIKVHGAAASVEERAASTPSSARPRRVGRAAFATRRRTRVRPAADALRKARRGRRDLLLPALHAVQDRVGWVSEGALNYICERLTVPPAEAWGVVTFYHLFATERRPRALAHVCDDLACRLAGSTELCERLEPSHRARHRLVTPSNGEPAAGSGAPVSDSASARRPRSSCAPARSARRRRSLPSAVQGTSSTALDADTTELFSPGSQRFALARRSVPQAGSPEARAPRARRRRRSREPRRLPGATAATAPFTGRSRSAAAVVAEVTASKLLGRGGAAFPAGRKWAAVAAAKETTRYVVCNADESEPGTFKDRVLLEDDPFAIVEAMTIAGFAVSAERGFIYLRGEYPRAEIHLARAHRRGAAGRAPRTRRRRRGLRLRHRDPARRRRLHLRRRDGALQLARRQARRAALEAALPGRSRPVRQADAGQQRRDARQRPADRPRWRRRLRRDRYRRFDRTEAVLRLGSRRPARRLRSHIRHDARRAPRARGRSHLPSTAQGDPARRRGGQLRRPDRCRFH